MNDTATEPKRRRRDGPLRPGDATDRVLALRAEFPGALQQAAADVARRFKQRELAILARVPEPQLAATLAMIAAGSPPARIEVAELDAHTPGGSAVITPADTAPPGDCEPPAMRAGDPNEPPGTGWLHATPEPVAPGSVVEVDDRPKRRRA